MADENIKTDINRRNCLQFFNMEEIIMLKRKLGFIVAALVGINMLTSCIWTVNNGSGKGKSGIDYTDYSAGKADYSILVRNESAENVVCFMGAPREENLISGARAGTKTGLKRSSTLFSTSKDFILFVVTEDEYLANKNDLKALDNTPFVMLYAYYNADSDSNANNVYTISKSIGGDTNYILINNPTKYNVELRQNGLYGDSLAYAGSYTTQTKIYVQPDNYNIFPVFRKFHRKSGEIITSFPQYSVGGVDYPVFFGFSLDNVTTSQEFFADRWLDGTEFDASEVPSAAYITVVNGNKGTGVSLYKGANAEAAITSTGGKMVNTGKELTFEVPMTQLGNNTYATSARVSGWKIGTSMKTVDLDDVVLEAGYMYYVDVSGSNYATVSAEWRMNGVDLAKDAVSFEEE